MLDFDEASIENWVEQYSQAEKEEIIDGIIESIAYFSSKDDEKYKDATLVYWDFTNFSKLAFLIKVLKKELKVKSLTKDNIKIDQLVEKHIDNKHDFLWLRLKFQNDSAVEVKNITIILDSDKNINHIHISDPNILNWKIVEDLNRRNSKDIIDNWEINNERWIELASNLNTPKNIAANMIEMHWWKSLLQWKEAVKQVFEKNAILKWTLDNTYSFWADLEDYFTHFCEHSPRLTLLKDKVNAKWLNYWETILATWRYVFNLDWTVDVKWNYTFIIKKVWDNNKRAFSLLHSSIINSREELKKLMKLH